MNYEAYNKLLLYQKKSLFLKLLNERNDESISIFICSTISYHLFLLMQNKKTVNKKLVTNKNN